MTQDDLEARDALLGEEQPPYAEQRVTPPKLPQSAAPGQKKPGRGLLIALAIVAFAAGGVVGVFKDRDSRLRTAADALQSAANASGATALAAQAKSYLSHMGLGKTDAGKVSREEVAPRAPEPQRLAQASGAAAEPAPAPVAAPAEPAPAPIEAPAVPARNEAKPVVAPEELATLKAQVAQAAEQSREAGAAARAALEAAQEAQRAVAEKARAFAGSAADAKALAEQTEYITALEGRIDALGDEIKQLRERMDQPKETARVEAETPRSAKSVDAQEVAELETMTLAQLLSEALRQGRPFVTEAAALKERDADPALLAALTPFAERGAPTAAALLAEFAPIARRLQAQTEQAHEGDSLSDSLLHLLGRLVRIKGAGAPPPASIEALIVEVETSLARDEVTAAAEGFAKLPAESSAEAKAFGTKLNELARARQAAADLIAGAVAGLAHNKN
jgi:hypothetical protein